MKEKLNNFFNEQDQINSEILNTQWQDQPDSEGWWWFYGRSYCGTVLMHDPFLVCFRLSLEKRINKYIVQTLGTSRYSSDFVGKWQKISEPQLPKE